VRTRRPAPRPTPRRRAIRLAAAVTTAFPVLLAGCEHSVHAPADTTARVWLVTPEAYDQAVLIAFDSPAPRFSPAPGFRAFPDPSASGTVLVVADLPLQPGETLIGTLDGPAGGAGGPSGATVLEVARSDFTLRQSLAGYRVRLAR
jgi:hypothetical protein